MCAYMCMNILHVFKLTDITHINKRFERMLYIFGQQHSYATTNNPKTHLYIQLITLIHI